MINIKKNIKILIEKIKRVVKTIESEDIRLEGKISSAFLVIGCLLLGIAIALGCYVFRGN